MESKLPKNWVVSTIAEISQKPQYGYTTKSTHNGKVRYLRTTDISRGKIDWNKVPFCEVPPENINKYKLSKDDIVVSRAGSIGLSYQLGNIPYETVFASYLIRFKPILVKSRYVKYYLLSPSFWDLISGASAGIAVQNINATKLSNFNINLPPLAEQERIVAKLDALFGSLEQVKTRMEKIPQLLKNFRQAILTQAVTGKLTEEWRKGKELEDIKLYLKSLKKLKDSKIEKKDNKSIVYEELESFNIPKEWKWVRLWDISYLVTSGSRGWSCYYSDEGANFVRSAEINNNVLRLDEAIKVNLPKKIEGKRSLIEKGNILTTVTGANVGKCAKVESKIPESYVSQSVALTKLVNEELTDYVHLSLLAPNSGGGMLKSMAYGLGRPVLSLPQIKSVLIPLPTAKEQTEIVKRVESLFAKADKIEERYNALKQQIDSLPQAILAKAFKGELVEQLLTDGNAADLLKEIQELKTATETTKKKKKK